MATEKNRRTDPYRPVLGRWPGPAKALATAIVIMLGIGMMGALGQIIVHDIIPTFFEQESAGRENAKEMPGSSAAPKRGDLFASAQDQAPEQAFYETEEFIFALKFTHIHIFGMSGIFIVMGALAFFLDRSAALRTWLIVLPFAGILVDLGSVWLKIFVHQAFFWLHVPGGALFAAIFAIESVLILLEIWIPNPPAAPSSKNG
ncbi:MAG: hypothetical protein K9L59_17515 [Desulfobacterales bacterium]|nr:hypothetical protein [Desulfobacterales bacterium]